eukprot:235817-Chlamydomonas_euryale.AAC.1
MLSNFRISENGSSGSEGNEAVDPTASKRIQSITDVARQSSAPVSVTVHPAEGGPFTVHR